jgi:4-hydroxybenzoate polyprenyltransferase
MRAGTFEQLDEFLRIYQIGFVAVWPLLGLAAARGWTLRSMATLVAISVCFNVAGGVLNDICDLDSDRRCPERAGRWLVTGAVSIGWARALVITQIPVMVAIHQAASFRAAALGWLGTAVVGQAFYDVFGKKSRTPPVAELGEALAAGSLVMYGAMCTTSTLPPLIWPTSVAAAAMLMLANAFHGGLRDLCDDLRSNVRTTPIWLGCSGCVDRVRISAAMSAYGAWWLLVLLLASMVVALYAPPLTRLVTFTGCALNVALFLALHRLRRPAWDIALRAHVALLAIPIMTAFTSVLSFGASLSLFTVYVTPVLPLTWRRAEAQFLSRRKHAALALVEPLVGRDTVFAESVAHQDAAP